MLTNDGKSFNESFATINVDTFALELDQKKPGSALLQLQAFFVDDCQAMKPQSVPLEVSVCGTEVLAAVNSDPEMKKVIIGNDTADIMISYN